MPQSDFSVCLPRDAEVRETDRLARERFCRCFENSSMRSATTYPPPRRFAIARRHAALACALGLVAGATRADCIADAAARHQVDADVLRAIGWQESRLQPSALGRNANGSIDIGAFQINSIHLRELGRYGIDRAALADGCVCADVAAWHYRRQVDLHGDGWQAVGAYHSNTPARAAWYANQIATLLMRWRVMPVGALPFPAARTLAPGKHRPSRVPPPPPQPLASAVAPSDRGSPATFSEIAYLPPAR